MEIKFGGMTFTVNESGVMGLTSFFGIEQNLSEKELSCFMLPEVDVAGGNTSGRFATCASKMTNELRYVSHGIDGNVLTIKQRNDSFEVTSVYTGYEDTNAIRITQSIKNITDEKLNLIMANTFGFCFGNDIVGEAKDWIFHRFTNARYTESMPIVSSLYDMGFFWHNGFYNMSNVGNVSALYNVPQGILQNTKSGRHIMFQIESYSSWHCEISCADNMFNMQLGGPNDWYHSWNKIVKPGASYETTPVTVCFGESVNSAVAEMTRYRRHIKGTCSSDAHLPSIYNEYMHYSWDDPYQDRAMKTAPSVAESGCEYYIIDCGWHDSREYDTTGEMYKHFGTWYEDRGRFPDGIKSVSDYMHSLGMKFGLWIAPEVVGISNEKMLAYYDDSCFMQKHGERICNGTGYLIDFRSEKVRNYMTETIDRMVNEYGCDYIKFDGCPNPGLGTEYNATSLGDGLEESIKAFTDWSKEMIDRHPNVIFEDCAGGGMRTDYKALSIFHLISTSDQINYMHYPYITANVMASVLPEQAAVWSYPVSDDVFKSCAEDEVNGKVSEERVVINMVNAVLGRIHLASRIFFLSDEKRELIREGIEFYNRITPEKLRAVPYFPKGYAKFGDTLVSVGLKTENKVYLAVWNLNGECHIELKLPEIAAKSASVAYPKSLETNFELRNNTLIIDFTENEQARIFEIEI